MPNLNQSFGGSTLIIPGTYYQDNVNANLPANTFPGLPLIFIGIGYGGVPKTAYNFSDANALQTFMRGSPSATFVNFMTDPSSQVAGAQQFVYINPAPNTPASGVLTDAASATVVTLNAANYGAPGNSIQYEVSAGNTAGINLFLSDPYTGEAYTGYNLGVPFQLTYTGTASTVTYTVTVSGGKATQFATAGGHAGENVTLDLTTPSYATISQILQYLNSTGAYTAQLLSDGNLPTSNLDAAASISLPVTSAVNVTATLGDIAYWVNNVAASVATATAASSVTSAPSAIPVASGLKYFTGGTNVTPSNSDYGDAFNVALSQQGWVVFADSSNSGVQALGAEHVAQASSIPAKTWRRFVTGSTLGDSITTTVSAARALNAINCTYVYPGIQAIDPVSGNTVVYSGLYAAAAVAGMMAGGPVALPETNKAINAVGVETLLTTADINTLQQNGVMPIYINPTTNVPTIVSDLTTWQNDANPENVFNQQVACRYALAYTITSALQPYVGQVASSAGETRVKNAAVRALNNSIYNDASGNGFLNSWDASTLVLSYDGTTQTLTITVNVILVGQYRFIEFTVSVQPLELTSTGA